MIAELTLTFKKQPANLLQIIQTAFLNRNLLLQQIIDNTIYQHRALYHDCFVHGFQATDATLLFQIIGSDLVVHIEIPPTNNLFVSLRAKVNSYYQNLYQLLTNNGVSSEDITQQVMISAEDSYILVGKLPNRKKDFLKQIDKDKYRIIIVPTVLLMLSIVAKYLKLIEKIETAIVAFVSAIVGIIIWYLIEYFRLTDDKSFKFEPINE